MIHLGEGPFSSHSNDVWGFGQNKSRRWFQFLNLTHPFLISKRTTHPSSREEKQQNINMNVKVQELHGDWQSNLIVGISHSLWHPCVHGFPLNNGFSLSLFIACTHHCEAAITITICVVFWEVNDRHHNISWNCLFFPDPQSPLLPFDVSMVGTTHPGVQKNGYG